MLEGVTEDTAFFGQLSEDYAKALQDYALGGASGPWLRGCARIESHIGRKLDERLMTKVMIPLLWREK